ncbi:MAG: hypothetical protein P8Y44_08255 [Acidobacteriota bacterium]
MKPKARSCLLVLLLTASCHRGNEPTSPLEPSLPTVQLWSLDWRGSSVTGANNCFKQEAQRAIHDEGGTAEELEITIAGSSIDLYWVPGDIRYSGTLQGADFEATAGRGDGSYQCRDGTVFFFHFHVTVDGHFSDDQRQLSAKEVWRYELEEGGAIAYNYDWIARRVR